MMKEMLSLIILLSIVLCAVGSNEGQYNDTILVVAQGVVMNPGDAASVRLFWYCPKSTSQETVSVNYLTDKAGGQFEASISSTTHRYSFDIAPGEKLKEYKAEVQHDGGVVYSAESVKNRINWMHDRKDQLGSFTLPELVIPGTHQSGAYPADYSGSENDTLRRWIYCQDKSIKQQLMDGIRYLDLQPIRLNAGKNRDYAILHDGHQLTPMDDVFREINEFMNVTEDVVIVSFSGFHRGFLGTCHHKRFIAHLNNHFRYNARYRSHGSLRLNDLWSGKKRLVLIYDDEMYKHSPLLWRPISQLKGNFQTTKYLHNYLSEALPINCEFGGPPRPECAPKLTALMSHLTHNNQILADKIGSRKQWAEEMAWLTFKWVTEEWSSVVNIIAVDYYEVTGIVDLAVQMNEKRALRKSSSA